MRCEGVQQTCNAFATELAMVAPKTPQLASFAPNLACQLTFAGAPSPANSFTFLKR